MSSAAPDASALLGTMKTDAHAMGLLHALNQGEIQAGTVAQSRAQNADVKAFAEQMVRDHTQLDEKGSALATRLNISPMLPDSTLPNMQMEGLRALSDSRVAGHQRALAIVDAAIAQAQNAELRTALQTDVRPPVAQHLQMAQQLLQKLGGR
jgi:putative membrane protein